MLVHVAGRHGGSGGSTGADRRPHACFVLVLVPGLVLDSGCFASARQNSVCGAAASGVPGYADGWVHHSFGIYLMVLWYRRASIRGNLTVDPNPRRS